MTTIEERALASWNERYPEGSERYRDAQIDGYIAGATEQKAIDEDAIHAIVEKQVLKAIEKQKAIDIDKACKVVDDLMMAYISGKLTHDEVMEECRKRMEE